MKTKEKPDSKPDSKSDKPNKTGATTDIIFVGYRLKKVPYLQDILNTVPEGEDDKSKQAASKARDKIDTAALENVYTCTFDEVFISVLSARKARLFRSENRKPDKPICVDIRNFLLDIFGDAWTDELFPAERSKPRAIFMGFDPRFFLKLLGLECSLPMYEYRAEEGEEERVSRLPVSMWYGNSDHRDIGEAVMPKTETKQLDWPQVLLVRGMGMAAEDRVRYGAVIDGWTGPGKNPNQDVEIAIELAAQVGLIQPTEDEDD